MAGHAARSDLADIATPLLHDHWYMAGYADAFDDGLHERLFLDRTIVIYRQADGELVALQNRCAHRSFPLSHGTREGDGIRCGYHGATFNARGEMTEFPSMTKCPRITVRRYPIVARGPIAWIWMGDPDRADAAQIPATPWLEPAGWRYASGAYELGGNWLLMAENLMDLTHIPFLHETSFNFPRAFAAAPIKLEIAGEQLSFYRDNPPNYQRSAFLRPVDTDAIECAGFSARSLVRFVSPALSYGGGHFALDRPEPGAPRAYEWQVIHFTTPMTHDRTWYWYFFSRNYALEDEALTATIKTMVVAGFEEDRVAIELIQSMHARDRHPFTEAHFKSDGPSVAMRRIVADMADREHRPSSVGDAGGQPPIVWGEERDRPHH